MHKQYWLARDLQKLLDVLTLDMEHRVRLEGRLVRLKRLLLSHDAKDAETVARLCPPVQMKALLIMLQREGDMPTESLLKEIDERLGQFIERLELTPPLSPEQPAAPTPQKMFT